MTLTFDGISIPAEEIECRCQHRERRSRRLRIKSRTPWQVLQHRHMYRNMACSGKPLMTETENPNKHVHQVQPEQTPNEQSVLNAVCLSVSTPDVQTGSWLTYISMIGAIPNVTEQTLILVADRRLVSFRLQFNHNLCHTKKKSLFLLYPPNVRVSPLCPPLFNTLPPNKRELPPHTA